MKFKPKNNGLLAGVWIHAGANEVLEELKKIDGSTSRLPGFALALAVAERTVADLRADLASIVLRSAAKAGADIGNSKGVFTSFEGFDVVLTVEPLDLAEVMEG